MKKILLFMCVLVMVVSLAACGESTPDIPDSTPSTNGQSTSNQDKNETIASSNNVSDKFEKTFDFYGYSVAYADDCSSSERTGGITVTRNADFWIVYSTPALFGEEFTVDGLEGIAEKCSNAVKQSVQSLQQYFDGSESTEVSVSNEVTKTIAGTDALRVEGVFKNTTDNTSVEYIGYYMTTNIGGSDYPIYIIGLPVEADINVLAEYLDESVKHISK